MSKALKLITTTLVFLALAGGANVCVAGISVQEKPATKTSSRPEKVDGESPRSATDSKKNKDETDSLTELRTKIEEAEDGAERMRLQLRLAEQLAAAGQKSEANKELREIINNDVFDPQGFYNTGNALARLGDSDGAIRAYHKAIEQRKGSYSRALNNLGVVLIREERWDEAYKALLSALKLENFRYAEASYNLGRLYFARGENELAIREWRRALSVDPEHKAAAQALSGDSRRAAVVGKPSASVKASSTISASAALPRPEANRPSPTFSSTKVLALDPLSYDYFQRAQHLREQGKFEAAVDNYRRVLARSHGYFPPANLDLSYALIALKRYDEALSNLLQVANRDGARFPIAYNLVARSYESKGDLALAEEWFAKAASAHKGINNSFLLDLSRVREHRGNFKGALAAMEEYVSAMERRGLRPAWSDESLAALRRKAGGN